MLIDIPSPQSKDNESSIKMSAVQIVSSDALKWPPRVPLTRFVPRLFRIYYRVSTWRMRDAVKSY